MVMGNYQTIVPIPDDCVYTIKEFTGALISVLGVFDTLELALHALDIHSKYRSSHMKMADRFTVCRVCKNTLKQNEKHLVTWTCTGEPKNGCSVGAITLSPCLRTHDIEH